MSSAREKYLERVHILRTLINYGSQTAKEVVTRYNAECDHPALEDLPTISARGMGSKLGGLWSAGLVIGSERATFDSPTVYEVTEKGRKMARDFELTEMKA